MSIYLVSKTTADSSGIYWETDSSNIYFMFGLQVPGRIRTTSLDPTLKNALQYLFLPRRKPDAFQTLQQKVIPISIYLFIYLFDFFLKNISYSSTKRPSLNKTNTLDIYAGPLSCLLH